MRSFCNKMFGFTPIAAISIYQHKRELFLLVFMAVEGGR